MKYHIKEHKTSEIARIPTFFLRVWLLMLTSGALGHQLNLHQLYRVGYWEAALIMVAWAMVDGVRIFHWVIEEEDVKA